MRIHGLGEIVVLVTDIIMKIPAAASSGWLRAPVNNAIYLHADGTLSVLRNAPLVWCAVFMVNEILVNSNSAAW